MSLNLNKFEKIRFWCQKVLPLVYDDSLSYYEVLCKLMRLINQLIDQINDMVDILEDHESRLDVLEAWKTQLETWKVSIQNQINNIINGTTEIALPIASASKLGGVKIGSGITIQTDGTISVEGGSSPYTLPTMSASVRGGARLGSGLKLTDTDKLDVDGANVDISENTSITNLENDIDDIIDGTTEIDISNNSSITTLETNVDNIIDGTTTIDISENTSITNLETSIENITSGVTPVPSSFTLPTMTASTKGGAKLGSGLAVTNDILSVDGSTIDISSNSTITNIINGTTPIPSSYTLPTMSSSTKGGAKVGNGLSVTSDVLSINTDIVNASTNISGLIGTTNGIKSMKTMMFTPTAQTNSYGVIWTANGQSHYTQLNLNLNSGIDVNKLRIYFGVGKGNSTNIYRAWFTIISYLGYDGDNNSIGTFYNGNWSLSGEEEGGTAGTLRVHRDGKTACVINVADYSTSLPSDFNFQVLKNSVASKLDFKNTDSYLFSQNMYSTGSSTLDSYFTPIFIDGGGFSVNINGLELNEFGNMNESININSNNIDSINRSIDTLNNKVAVNIPQSTESTYPTVTEFNNLLTALKNAGLMVADV